MGVKASFYPNGINYVPILDFLHHPLKPLSLKATLGFYNRVCASTLIKYPEQFKQSIEIYPKDKGMRNKEIEITPNDKITIH